MKNETHGDLQVLEVDVRLPGFDASAVRVALDADARDGSETVRQEMTRLRDLPGAPGGVYSATTSAARPASDFTARLCPRLDGVSVPLEAGANPVTALRFQPARGGGRPHVRAFPRWKNRGPVGDLGPRADFSIRQVQPGTAASPSSARRGDSGSSASILFRRLKR